MLAKNQHAGWAGAANHHGVERRGLGGRQRFDALPVDGQHQLVAYPGVTHKDSVNGGVADVAGSAADDEAGALDECE